MMKNLAPGKKDLGSLRSRLARMLHHECDALEGYRFWGGPYHFQPLPAKLVFAYFDRGSYIYIYIFFLYINI